MWLIVGLGNPGSKYRHTRHNIGFDVIDSLSEKYNIQAREYDDFIRYGGLIDDEEVVLLKPLTYMNRSGIAVKRNLYKYSIPLERLIVIHDDLDLSTGLLKLKKNGGTGGHKGLESIVVETGSNEFIRVRIGIGRNPDIVTDQYVLSRFLDEERKVINEAILLAQESILEIMTKGIDYAMNKFNKKNK